MTATKTLTISFRESVALLRKNKFIVLSLVVLQMLFIFYFASMSNEYIPKITAPLIGIDHYLGKIDFEKNSAEKKPIFGDDPLIIHRNLSEAFFNLKLLMFFILPAYILIGGVSWSITNSMVKKTDRRGVHKHLSKFGLLSLISFLIIFLFLYPNLNPNVLFKGFPAQAIMLISIIVFYFMFISFSLIRQTSMKEMPKKLFLIGIKKMHIIILSYFIMAAVIVFFTISTIILVEYNLVIMSLSFILFILSIVWSRLFLVLVVDKIK